MTKKILNKKQKIVISIVAALLIIALGVTAYVMISKKTRTTVALADVTAGDITETLKLSGTVNSENQASFEILDGTYVKSVNVRVGDAVKKGDVLATFDTSSLLEPIGQLTNGDLLKMTDEEWQSQIEYIKVLAELILNKYKKPHLPVTAPAAFSVSRNDARDMAKSVNNAGRISKATAARAEDVIELANEVENAVDEKASKEFIATYKEFADASDDISSVIGDLSDKIFTEEKIAKMISFVECAAYLSTSERGFDLYTLDSDLNVEIVTTNGFGDPYNHGCRTFAVTDDSLVVGTANPFYGTQVWTLAESKSDVDYDINSDGKVDVNDATYIQHVVAGSAEKPDNFDSKADFNKDGKVDVTDITAYQIYLAKNNN